MKDSQQQQKACCNDEQKFVKDNSDQNITEPVFHTQQKVVFALTAGFVEINPVAIYPFIPGNPIKASPPRSKNLALYLSNRVFRI